MIWVIIAAVFLMLLGVLVVVVVWFGKQQSAQLRAKIEADLPERLNPHLPADVHTVVSLRPTGRLR